MAQQSWKIEKDDADCEVLKPPSPAASSPPAAAPMYVGSAEASPAERPGKAEEEAAVPDLKAAAAAAAAEAEAGQARAVRFTNRCSSCQKRVGLTGFRCRCGELFCGRHRYSDAHDCSFDYKAAGREQISKANPLIRAAKIIKI